MRRNVVVSVCFAILWCPDVLRAQSIPRDLVVDVRDGVRDMFFVWVSPFRGSSHDFLVRGSALGLVGLSAIEDDNVAGWVRHQPNAGVLRMLRPIREGQGQRFVDAAGGSGHLPGAAALYATGLLVRSRSMRDAGMGCLAAGEAHSAIRQIVYMSVSRERPFYRDSVNGDVVERAGRPYHVTTPGRATGFDNSFFGGHAASAFSCATFVNRRFHMGYVEPVIWAFAGALSLGRIADQRHYVSDVLVGALIGFGAGKVVADRSRDRADKRISRGATMAPASARDTARSWSDGLYVSRQGNALVAGWHTVR